MKRFQNFILIGTISYFHKEREQLAQHHSLVADGIERGCIVDGEISAAHGLETEDAIDRYLHRAVGRARGNDHV